MKQATLARLLADRAERPAFYADAAYEALPAEGARAGHVIAFTRSDVNQGVGDLLVAVPRLVSGFTEPSGWSAEAFAGTTLSVVGDSTWVDLVTGETREVVDGRIELDRLFARLPYAVLKRTH